MTKREFYTAIVNGEITEEVTAFATAQIERLDNVNAKRREKPSKKALENAVIGEKIIAEILSNEPKTASEIGAELGNHSSQKVIGILRPFIADGTVVKTELKIKGHKVNGYSLA